MSRDATPLPTPVAPPQPAIAVEPALAAKSGAADARTHLKDMERQLILDALIHNQYNKAAVARELGIPLSTLKRRLKDYRIGDEE